MTRRLAAIGLIWTLADVAVHACPVCFQFEDSATTAGVRAAVIVLLSVTLVVLAGVAAWWVTRGTAMFSSPVVSSGTGTAEPVEKSNGPL
jgi:hypothetical protein